MKQLPYELDFMHKYNLHKTLGLLIEDDDLRSIARVYGVKVRELKKLEASFKKNVSEMAGELRRRFPPRPPGKACVIAAIGDSITSDRASWVKVLNCLWQDEGKRRVIDCAVSGDTTYNVINRFYATVMNQSFDWAVLFLGTNDSRKLDDESRISNISIEEYKRNITYFTDALLNRGKEVVHVTISQVDNGRFKPFFSDKNWIYDSGRIDETNNFIRELSKQKETHLADLAARLTDCKGDVFGPDGIHLNREGQMILCELLLEILP